MNIVSLKQELYIFRVSNILYIYSLVYSIMSNLEIISKCDVRQQFLFLTTCLGRTKNLYSLFEVEIKHDKFDYANKFKNASEKINKFYQECLSILFDNSDSFNTDPNLFYELAPSYEEYSTVTETIATQIALLCTSVGEFI